MTVFISYSHSDSALVSKICKMLDKDDVKYFRDVKHIDWGKDIEDSVRVALHTCSSLMVVLSPGSLESAWVPYELGHARALKKDILPFLTHPKLKIPAYLQRLSYVDTIDAVRDHFKKRGFRNDVTTVVKDLQHTVSKLADTHAIALTGKWTGEGHQQRGPENEHAKFSVTLDLVANDHEVNGEMRLRMPYRGSEYTGSFSISGGFVGGRFVWVNYVGSYQHRPHFGTMIWDLSKVDVKLVGEYVGYGALGDRIVSGYAKLDKIE